MYFFERVKNISLFLRPLSKKIEVTIPSKEEFYKVLERERARADRSGDLFSIVVFEVDHRDKSESDEQHLIENISMRIRPTDDMGGLMMLRLGLLYLIHPRTEQRNWLMISVKKSRIKFNRHLMKCILTLSILVIILRILLRIFLTKKKIRQRRKSRK